MGETRLTLRSTHVHELFTGSCGTNYARISTVATDGELSHDWFCATPENPDFPVDRSIASELEDDYQYHHKDNPAAMSDSGKMAVLRERGLTERISEHWDGGLRLTAVKIVMDCLRIKATEAGPFCTRMFSSAAEGKII